MFKVLIIKDPLRADSRLLAHHPKVLTILWKESDIDGVYNHCNG